MFDVNLGMTGSLADLQLSRLRAFCLRSLRMTLTLMLLWATQTWPRTAWEVGFTGSSTCREHCSALGMECWDPRTPITISFHDIGTMTRGVPRTLTTLAD